jgi:hypothetical protein
VDLVNLYPNRAAGIFGLVKVGTFYRNPAAKLVFWKQVSLKLSSKARIHQFLGAFQTALQNLPNKFCV